MKTNRTLAQAFLIFCLIFSFFAFANKPTELPTENNFQFVDFGAETQKPEDSFASGKLPRALERMANQHYEIASMLTTINGNLGNVADSVPVAIVDTGVDLAHPDLVRQLRYQVVNGKVVGSGLDALGSDNFASANLISPRLFAFGAKAIVGGKIVEPRDNPIDHLVQLNYEFVDRFLDALRKHPILKDSMFARKLNKENFTLLGAHLFLTNNEFDKMRYNAFKSAGLLVSEDIRSRIPKSAYKDKIHPLDLHYLVDQEWRLDPETGLPHLPTINESPFARSLLKVEHADEFYSLLQKVFLRNANTGVYGASLAPFVSYVGAREFSVHTPQQIRTNSVLRYLVKAYHYQKNGAQSIDPMVDTLRLLELHYVLVNARNGKIFDAPLNPTKSVLNEGMAMILSMQEDYLHYMDQFPIKSAIEERAVKKIASKFGAINNLLAWYFYDRVAIKKDSESKPGVPLQPGWDSRHRKFFHRTMHPYLGSTPPSSHGTHVAGITAIQHPKISIEPIRVGLGDIVVNPVEAKRISQHFRKTFKEFIANPVIFRAIASELSDHANELDLGDQSFENRQKIADYLVQVFESQIKIVTESAPGYFSFIGELKKSIRHVGAAKIPVVNMSLGGEFDESIRRASILKGGRPDLERDIESLFSRLFQEHHKFTIATEIKRSAPDTVFVIAAGNSGSWIDGESKGAAPAELASAFLNRFERPELGEVIVNNTLDNIIAVGSWSTKERPSSYSNLLLGSTTPLVFIEGEHVLSPVRSVDPRAIAQIVNDRIPELAMFAHYGPTDRRFAPLWATIYKQLGSSFESRSESDLQEAEQLFAVGQKIIKTAVNGLALHLFAEFPESRARMSGTSMAAPAVAGLIGKSIAEKAAAQGLALNEVYGHADFKPAKLIREILALSERTLVAGNHEVLRLNGEKIFTRSTKGDALENFLSEAIEQPDQFWVNKVASLVPDQNPLSISPFDLIGAGDGSVDITNNGSGPVLGVSGRQNAPFLACETSFKSKGLK